MHSKWSERIITTLAAVPIVAETITTISNRSSSRPTLDRATTVAVALATDTRMTAPPAPAPAAWWRTECFRHWRPSRCLPWRRRCHHRLHRCRRCTPTTRHLPRTDSRHTRISRINHNNSRQGNGFSGAQICVWYDRLKTAITKSSLFYCGRK